MCDIDAWYTLEMRRDIPVALVSYKRQGYKEALESEMTTAGFRALGNKAKLPVFEVIYSSDMRVYIVDPKNGAARDLESGGVMDEMGFVSLLYRLRKMQMPPEIHRVLEAA